MKEKKLMLLAGLIAVPAIVNIALEKLYETKNAKNHRELYYFYKYGDVHYQIRGSGKPLLLIHDVTTGSGLHEWEASIELLSKDYKVYALDLLGFGFSDKPNMSYSPYLYVNLILDFVKDVIGEKVSIAASGNAATYAVFADAFEPAYVEKMILIQPNGNDAVMPDRFVRRIWETPLLGTSLFHWVSSKKMMRTRLGDSFGNGSPDKKIVQQYCNAAHFGGSNAKYSTAAFLSHSLDTSMQHKISAIQTPTLVLWGEYALKKHKKTIRLFSQNPRMQIALLKDTNCLPHVEQPKQFYAVCKTFLS